MNRLKRDWQRRYGHELLLVETFVDTQHYRGTCYRASNWIDIGRTQGRGRQDAAHRHCSSVKQVFVYALDAKAKQRLCKAEIFEAAPVPPHRVAIDWAEEEFVSQLLRVIKAGLIKIARDLCGSQAQIPQVRQSRGQ
jgi:hypothetical protein